MSHRVRGVEARARPPDEGAEARVVAAEPTVHAGHVLALQRSAGNAAVGRLLRQQRSGQEPTKPRRDPAPQKPRTTIRTEVEPGGLLPSQPRTPYRVLNGDLMVIKARVAGDGNMTAVAPVIELDLEGLSVESTVRQPNSVVWKVRAIARGRYRLSIITERGVNQRTIEVVGDADDELTAILDAQAIITRRYGGARTRVWQASRAFKKAYDEHESQLRKAAAGESLDKDLLFMVVVFALGLFPLGASAAVGRLVVGEAAASTPIGSTLISTAGLFVGGAIADVLALVFYGNPLSGTAEAPTGEGITEPGRGINEFASRMLARPARKTAGGSRSPILADPVDFLLKLELALLKEDDRLQKDLGAVTDSLIGRAARSSRALFDTDPVARASRPDVVLDRFALQLETDWKAYYEALWAAWVNRFYYRVRFQPSVRHPKSDGVAYRVDSAGRHIDDQLDIVVKNLGNYPNRQAFLAKYADRQAREKEAARLTNRYWSGKD
jgi:hypothetical protein